MPFIDLDKLREHLSRAHKTHLNDGRVEYSCGILLASDIAYNEPKVDAVEVVRCKDCKHRTNKGICEKFRQRYPFFPEDDFYCSYGEQKGCTTCKQLCCDGCELYEESEVEGE